MPFTGKATYSAGATLPEIAEDVADLVSISSPHETPLLDALGDSPRVARSTVHEWLEDALIPNTDTISDTSLPAPTSETVINVANIARFRTGDLVQPGMSSEIMLVTAVNAGTGAITVQRGYGGSTATSVSNGMLLTIVGNAAIEGDDATEPRFTNRVRQANYTQIFASTVEVSGSELAVRQVGVRDELDWQKANRLRELLRDLENCVINGRAAAANPQGTTTTRRTLRGIIPSLTSNRFAPGESGVPSSDSLTEDVLNFALRRIWRNSAGSVDLIVVNGLQKRQLNRELDAARQYAAGDSKLRSVLSTYESDFGVCKIVTSRYVPQGTALLLDSSRLAVMPLAGRSFHYRPLARTGDRESGQLVGEYTLELRNESAHGVITNLGTE